MTLPTHLTYKGRAAWLKYHRLLSGTHPHPPNSLSALAYVLEGGAAVIEFDVNRTEDGAYVLNHDLTLERETTGVGPLARVTQQEFKALRLRGTDEPPATLAEVVAVLKGVQRSLKVQIDLKELLPLPQTAAIALLEAIAPLRENAHLRVVVGCLGDWNLRLLRRLDPELLLGFDFAYHLDVPVESLVRLPMRVNAYGYLDDHPLGYRRLLSAAAYLRDRVEALVSLLPSAVEFYLRKEFVLKALADGFNPVAFIHAYRPGTVVDVWTLNASEPEARRTLTALLEAGADQITSNTPVQLAAMLEGKEG
ncbi:glycerophosphodiester phosphodiesterase [Marinithermus hydrothermalis]|uniref:Glycerophosphoryl diester phosphodiesterase n=1 Tax=Marinithermus hydrothermalis (strain DSM 14884 / JCM 11576 / T1) TaxID=869210 RepID=F2NQF3_MARHT|nr:glycerophosphodiester phosphodiesterase family protein [Marinithermus hydrothermalis]AEB11680.1 glycerophosphoryl diester phosphodiesterase [Marinithermus hydrothermalis DSM 14884]